MRNNRFACLTSIIFLTFPFAIQAQDLIGGNGGVDVDTSGLPVYAYAVGNTNSPNVNGVSFLSAVEDANHNYQDSNVLIHNFTSSSVFGVPASVAPESAYATLVGSGGYSAGKGNDITLTLNVTAGRNYELDFWANDTRSEKSPESEAITDPQLGGPFVFGFDSPLGADGGFGGVYLQKYFTAGGPTQVIDVSTNTDYTLSSTFQLVTAFQLRDVTPIPEPAPAMSAGIAVSALLKRRRSPNWKTDTRDPRTWNPRGELADATASGEQSDRTHSQHQR